MGRKPNPAHIYEACRAAIVLLDDVGLADGGCNNERVVTRPYQARFRLDHPGSIQN